MTKKEKFVETKADWVQTVAVITASTYHYARMRDVNLRSYMDRSFFIIQFSYVVDGKTYEDKFEQFEGLGVGTEIMMLYNSAQPYENSLSEPKLSISGKVVSVTGGIVLAGLIIYLERRFNIPSRSDFGR